MFARVITAQSAPGRFDDVIRLAEQQLPEVQALPGFSGYHVLTNAGSGKVVIISLWQTREQMDTVTDQAGTSGIRSDGIAETGLTALQLETFEVPVSRVP